MSFKAIVATCKDNGIGINNELPWKKIDEDMKLFSKLTKGNGNNSIIMGKNTFLSIGRLLPNRFNIIISKSLDENNYKDLITPQMKIFDSIETCVDFCKEKQFSENFVIGGESIYREFFNLNIIDTIFETKIYEKYNCDTFFPSVPLKYRLDTIRHIRKNPTCIFLKWQRSPYHYY
tara:strand:- start:2222 stop:2749 length:528 start_codon:yes stop_codon:yes gene_type:complete